MPSVFISYSHLDPEWKDRFVRHLNVSVKQGHFEQWNDEQIGAGEDWYAKITAAMDAASVAVFLISADFLGSDFILREEVTKLIERREREGLHIVPVYLRDCDWQAVPWLARMQMRPGGDRPIARGEDLDIDQAFAEIAKEIRLLLHASAPSPSIAPGNHPDRYNSPAAQPAPPQDQSPSDARTTDRTFYSIDSPADSDALDRRHLAHAISYLLDEVHGEQAQHVHASRDHLQSDPGDFAFLVNLHGRWGAGKSSLLNFLKQHLQDRGRERPWIVVELNAWQHQRFSVPWWSILSELYSQSVNQLHRLRAPNASTVRIREFTWRLRTGWGTFLIAIAGFLWLSAYASLGIAENNDWSKSLGDTLSVVAGVVAAWAAVTSLGNFILLGSARTAKLLTEFRRDPMKPMIDHFRDLVASIWYPVVFFIDDSDRCDSEYVVDLLQTIQTLYRGAPVIYIVAADRRWINRSYHDKFADFAEDYKETGRSLGDLFLEKIFQISISLPSINKRLRRDYWGKLLGENVSEVQRNDRVADKRLASEMLRNRSEEEILTLLERGTENIAQDNLRWAAVERLSKPDAVSATRHFLLDFVEFVDPNPRLMKRMLNLFRIRRDFKILAGSAVDREHLALWSIVETQWPLLADALAENPELATVICRRETPQGFNDEVSEMAIRDDVRKVFGGIGSRLDADSVRACLHLLSQRSDGQDDTPFGERPPQAAADSAHGRALSKAPDLTRLPQVGEHLFGRRREWALLDGAWADEETNIVSLVAWGGVGKSALVKHWLGRMAKAQFRGAVRVFGWSFYSQGTKEGEASADEFFAEALRWFGESSPEEYQQMERARRLAELIQGQRTLLVLDGLEPLQQPPGPEEGRLKDQTLAELLRLLEWQNPGLVVITTRLLVDDIRDLRASTAPVVELGNLAAPEGAQLLQALGVKGEQEELEAASREFGGHGLALNLLGTYLCDILEGDVCRRGEVSLLEEDAEQGGHARRIMRSYEKQLSDSAELAVLHLIGLFDRPARRELIDVLRRPPQIDGLNERLVDQSERQWQGTLARLKHAKLLSEDAPDELDAHPLVREHFGARLRQERPEAWRAGQGRLYEHLKTSAKELPDTLAEMAPLFQAMHHGCQAGRHEEALDEVYWARILRGAEHYNGRKLGAFGADLAALAGLFDPPFEKPVASLTEAVQAFILNEAAFDLRALGRLREAVAPMRVGLERRIEQESWQNAAISASNLSELQLTLGDVAEAVKRGEASVAHADRSEDAFQRMGNRTTWADALHQAGEAARARALLEEAEALQAESQPAYPRLYSVRGYRYCDLLLAQGRPAEVRERAAQTLEWVTRAGMDLLSVALDHLSLGRAALALGAPGEARTQLDQAVDGLRQAGQMDDLPRGLLARAALFRAIERPDLAGRDLDEAMRIAKRGEMLLFQCDAHLEYARLALAKGDRDQAHGHVSEARQVVEKGYNRRRPEVEELAAAVG